MSVGSESESKNEGVRLKSDGKRVFGRYVGHLNTLLRYSILGWTGKSHMFIRAPSNIIVTAEGLKKSRPFDPDI